MTEIKFVSNDPKAIIPTKYYLQFIKDHVVLKDPFGNLYIKLDKDGLNELREYCDLCQGYDNTPYIIDTGFSRIDLDKPICFAWVKDKIIPNDDRLHFRNSLLYLSIDYLESAIKADYIRTCVMDGISWDKVNKKAKKLVKKVYKGKHVDDMSPIYLSVNTALYNRLINKKSV